MIDKNYTETQRMRMWWVYAICVLILGSAVWAFVMQIVFDKEFGSNPGPDWVIYATLGISIALVWLVFAAKLVLKVNADGVSFRYYPFMSKKFSWTDIKEVKVIKYNPVKDYAGWGLRYNWNNKGKAYSISGNKGLDLTLKNDRKVLIGTAKAEELQVFLDENKFIN